LRARVFQTRVRIPLFQAIEKPGLKPTLENEALFRWTEVQLPPAEAGGSHPT
jgi:hypothetical protein